jgi:hypothetical protein
MLACRLGYKFGESSPHIGLGPVTTWHTQHGRGTRSGVDEKSGSSRAGRTWRWRRVYGRRRITPTGTGTGRADGRVRRAARPREMVAILGGSSPVVGLVGCFGGGTGTGRQLRRNVPARRDGSSVREPDHPHHRASKAGNPRVSRGRAGRVRKPACTPSAPRTAGRAV